MNQHLNASELRWVVKYRAGLRPAEKGTNRCPDGLLKRKKRRRWGFSCVMLGPGAHTPCFFFFFSSIFFSSMLLLLLLLRDSLPPTASHATIRTAIVVVVIVLRDWPLPIDPSTCPATLSMCVYYMCSPTYVLHSQESSGSACVQHLRSWRESHRQMAR